MLTKLIMICFFGGLVFLIYGISMLSVPHRGWTKMLECFAGGILLCAFCDLLLSPLGISIPQTPFSAVCASCLGIPGVAFSVILSVLP